MTVWTKLRCHRCRQTIHRLDGYMEEPSVNGDPKGVWPYHYECWYTLLKDRGAKWIEPFAADSDTVPAAHM